MPHLLMKYAERLWSAFYQQGPSELPLDQEIQLSKVASVLSTRFFMLEMAHAKADKIYLTLSGRWEQR